jgi:hypothetical protein
MSNLTRRERAREVAGFGGFGRMDRLFEEWLRSCRCAVRSGWAGTGPVRT